MTVRRAVKRLVAQVAARLVGLSGPRMGPPAPILCYHGVAAEPVPEQVGARDFIGQMELLGGRRSVRPLTKIVDTLGAASQAEPPGGARIALTFDDGYANLVPHALPVLERLSRPATVFVVPGRLGEVADWPSPAPPSERRLLSRLQVDSLREVGVEIGAHGWSHVDLTRCSAQQRADEIGRCAEFLRRELGVGRPMFCYPWGRFDAAVADEVERAGFVGAVAGGWGIRHRPVERFSLRRVVIDPTDTLRDFALKLRGGWGWWTRAWWRDLLGA